jgi:predicted  nucleic acid-binding Zn-ribbon protein
MDYAAAVDSQMEKRVVVTKRGAPHGIKKDFLSDHERNYARNVRRHDTMNNHETLVMMLKDKIKNLEDNINNLTESYQALVTTNSVHLDTIRQLRAQLARISDIGKRHVTNDPLDALGDAILIAREETR